MYLCAFVYGHRLYKLKTFNLNLYIDRALKIREDMRVPQQGGGYTPPAAGLARARLVGYFELGTHEEEFEGKLRDREKVELIFELSGPNHEPRKLDDGALIPVRTTVQETLSFDPRSSFFKLFVAMNYSGRARHMAELLGAAFVVEVFHRQSSDRRKIYANLKGPNGYNVRGPTIRDERTGWEVPIEVAPAITELRAFIWDVADKDMWDSILIEGEYPERKEGDKVVSPARSKNVIQERIMAAKNWPQHLLYQSLVAEGCVPDVHAIERARLEAIDRQEHADMLRLREWVKDCVTEALTEARESPPRRRRPGMSTPKRSPRFSQISQHQRSK